MASDAITIGLRELLVLASLWAASVWAFAKLFGVQFEKRLSERFASYDSKLESRSKQMEDLSRKLERTEAHLSTLAVELPVKYVLHADYVRMTTGIDAKLDKLNTNHQELLRAVYQRSAPDA